jgi:hypothetical protein
MRIHARTAGAGAVNINYILQVAGLDTLLTTSMLATTTDGSDLVNSIAVAAGALIGIKITKDGVIATSPADIMCSIEQA